MNKNCGASGCALGPFREPSTDIGLPFYFCPACTALRLPEEALLHSEVEPDRQARTPGIMSILFRMREVWLKLFIPELRHDQVTILDAGCGDGQFLEYLTRRGFSNACGYEINSARLKNAQRRGVKTFPDLVSAVSAQGPRFRVIFLWHVFEHIPQPVPVLQDLLRYLEPEGVLILSVPNHGSLQTRLFGKFSAFVDYHRHLWFFRSSYFDWLKQALPGFTVRRIRDLNFEYEIYGWIDTLAAALLRRTNFVHLALKKNEGGAGRRLAAAAIALTLAPAAGLLAGVTVLAQAHASTLTYAIRPNKTVS